MGDVKTLILDIETIPTQAYVWGLFDQNVGLSQIIKGGGVVSWAAKWAGSDEVEFSSTNMTSHKNMIHEVWKLLNEADEVVGWNSNSFDLKWLNAAFAVYGFGPPSPYKKIDLMRTVKSQMKFISNKLDFVSGEFGVGHKLEHEGFDLWVKIMRKDQEAWKRFEDYNVQDVLLTERMYNKLRGWITNGVNRSTVANAFVCPICGGTHLQKRGKALTTTMTYQRYQCMTCGAWPRERIAAKIDRSMQLVRTV
jgi:hypothetical protein